MSTPYTNTRNYIIDSRTTTYQPETNRWTVNDNFLDSLVDIKNPDLVRIEIGVESMSLETGWFNVDETNNELLFTENGAERKIVIPPGKYDTFELERSLAPEGSSLRFKIIDNRLLMIGNGIVVNNECSARSLLGLNRTKSKTVLLPTWYKCPFPVDLRRIHSISVCTDLMPGQSGESSRIHVPNNSPTNCELLATIPVLYDNISTPLENGKLIHYSGTTVRNILIPKQSSIFSPGNRQSPFKNGSFDIWLVDQNGDTVDMCGCGWHLNLKINSIIEPNKYPFYSGIPYSGVPYPMNMTTETTDEGTKYTNYPGPGLGTISTVIPSTTSPQNPFIQQPQSQQTNL